MTSATATIPRQTHHSVTAASPARAQIGALKCWKDTRLALTPFVVLGASGALADDMRMPMNGKDIKWGPAPPFFPKGAEFAVLLGDPSKNGLYVVRLKKPAGYNISFSNHDRNQKVPAMAPTSESNAKTQADALTFLSEIVSAKRQGHHVRRLPQ